MNNVGETSEQMEAQLDGALQPAIADAARRLAKGQAVNPSLAQLKREITAADVDRRAMGGATTSSIRSAPAMADIVSGMYLDGDCEQELDDAMPMDPLLAQGVDPKFGFLPPPR
jgi:hypothetical protein